MCKHVGVPIYVWLLINAMQLLKPNWVPTFMGCLFCVAAYYHDFTVHPLYSFENMYLPCSEPCTTCMQTAIMKYYKTTQVKKKINILSSHCLHHQCYNWVSYKISTWRQYFLSFMRFSVLYEKRYHITIVTLC